MSLTLQSTIADAIAESRQSGVPLVELVSAVALLRAE